MLKYFIRTIAFYLKMRSLRQRDEKSNHQTIIAR